MTVYVDDMLMRADVPNGARTVRGVWSHMIADTPEELHEFADRLGLRRSWFQEPKGLGGRGAVANPESRAAQNWHYDVTKSKREQAIRMGAVPVTRSEMREIINQRHARLFPEAAAKFREGMAEIGAKWRATTEADSEARS